MTDGEIKSRAGRRDAHIALRASTPEWLAPGTAAIGAQMTPISSVGKSGAMLHAKARFACSAKKHLMPAGETQNTAATITARWLTSYGKRLLKKLRNPKP
jgi:hypothetical protein